MIPMRPSLVCLALVAAAGCHDEHARPSDTAVPNAPPMKKTEHALAVESGPSQALAELRPLGQSGVSGSLTFTALDGGVRVTGEVRGLAPGSTHGFHVHEKGDCSAPDGSSAGGHFDPQRHPHGAPASADSHLGDLGNVVADAGGVAHVSVVKRGASIAGEPTSYVGHAVIVHAGADDLRTQPTGNSGGRVACGVVRLP